MEIKATDSTSSNTRSKYLNCRVFARPETYPGWNVVTPIEESTSGMNEIWFTFNNETKVYQRLEADQVITPFTTYFVKKRV